jgi:hypothetical protein
VRWRGARFRLERRSRAGGVARVRCRLRRARALARAPGIVGAGLPAAATSTATAIRGARIFRIPF